jgi:hypothetical protein
MATAKKTPAKKVAAKKTATKDERILVSQRTIAKVPADQKFAMPMEVKNWIDQAHSTINHLRGEVERLKKENTDLKAYKKWAEHRILRSDYE